MKDYDLLVLMTNSLLRITNTRGMKLFNKKTPFLTIHLAFLSVLSLSSLNGQILPYKDAGLKVEERVKDLMNRMTIEEKVNQMLKLNLADLKLDKEGNITKESLENLFHGESIGCLDPPIIDVKGISKFSEAADQYLRKNTRLGIPAIQVELSGLHGQLAYGATNFPQAIGQGCTWNTELI